MAMCLPVPGGHGDVLWHRVLKRTKSEGGMTSGERDGEGDGLGAYTFNARQICIGACMCMWNTRGL